jgi:cell wall-associated NlpC family hydrolase
VAPALAALDTTNTVQVIPATETLWKAAATGGDTIRRLLESAPPTIGVPYEWGGVNLETGVDCSGYTWQLFNTTGFGYERYLNTKALSKITERNGLRQISYEEATAGDLLVYGYFDETNKWHGHVVILVDKDGTLTGHKGLVLGAHGPPVDQVQFITFTGFDEGYYKAPHRRLRNVLRVDPPPQSEKPVPQAVPDDSAG